MRRSWRLGRLMSMTLLCACAHAAAVGAQTRTPAAPANRLEVDIGPVWIGSGDFGVRSATETVPTGSRFVLFSTSTRLDASAGVEARVGYYLTPIFEVEGVTSYSVPQLRTTVSSDAEASTPATAAVGVTQVTIGGALVAHLPRFRIGGHAVPFLEGGAGYLRQLYDSPSAAVSGQTYEAGGGVKYTFSRRAGRRFGGLGVRADVRAVARRRGVAPDGGTHVSPAAGASLFLLF